MIDEILLQILGKLTTLEEGQQRLEAKVDNLGVEVAALKTEVAALKTEVDGLKTEVAGLKTEVDGLKAEVDALKTDVAVLKTDVAGLKESVAVIEVEHGRSLGALHDGYKTLFDELAYIKPIVETTADDVEIIKVAVSRHASIFNALKLAI